MTKIKFFLAVCCCFFFAYSATSQTIRYVKTIATGSGTGASWANASSNLQAMIDASADNDEVWVAKGIYKPTMIVGVNAAHVAYTDDRHKSFYIHSGVKLYGSFAGSEVTTGQRKLSVNKTFLSGDMLGNDGTGFSFTNNTENAYHVIVAISAHTLRIDGFTISGGNTTGMPATYLNNAPAYTQLPADGAGIYSYDSDYYITSNIFINNYSTGNGGAVCNRSFSETGDLTCSIFINNRAAQGSALYVSNGGATDATSYLTNCTVFKNYSAAATIFTANASNKLTIYNSLVMYNYGSGRTIDTTLITILYSYYHALSISIADPGADPLDPFFTNALDPDGADNILGTSDDGLIPGCGPAIGGGLNMNLPLKDIRDSVRIQKANIDMGAYETSLAAAVTGISISQAFGRDPYDNDDNNPYNDLPAPGLCEGGTAAHFTAAVNGNGGVFQWKKNGINVGTNSSNYDPTDFHLNDQVWVTYVPAPGCGTAGTIQSNIITLQNVSTGKPVLTTAIMGAANACPFLNGAAVAYKINKVPGAVVYSWGLYTPGATIVSHPGGIGVNDTIVMVAFTQEFISGSIAVAARNWCGFSSIKRLSISLKIPQSAGTISGPTDLCPFIQSATNPAGTAVTYTIRKVIDASSYAWTVPAGASITSHPGGAGFNDTIITVLYSSSFVSGVVTAQGINFCGSKAPRSLSVLKRAAGTPGTISGPADACPYKQAGTAAIYTIKKVLYAASYTWTIPAGATATHPNGTGINDTSISVSFSGNFVGGAITVVANTNCSSSSARSLSLPYRLPSTPGTVTAGAASACPTRRITYSLAALPSYATAVQWTVPASGTIISGQGTLSLVVQYNGPTAITDSIRVVGINACGASSAQRKLKVALLGACRAGKNNEATIPVAGVAKKLPAAILNSPTELNITVMPNPSSRQFTLLIKGGDRNVPVNMLVLDETGRIIEKQQQLFSNQTIQIGETFKPGIYFASFIQAGKKKIIRLVKL